MSTMRAILPALFDGAAAVLLGSKQGGESLGLKPRAKIRAFTNLGSEPNIMLTGPVECHQETAEAGQYDDRRHRSF